MLEQILLSSLGNADSSHYIWEQLGQQIPRQRFCGSCVASLMACCREHHSCMLAKSIMSLKQDMDHGRGSEEQTDFSARERHQEMGSSNYVQRNQGPSTRGQKELFPGNGGMVKDPGLKWACFRFPGLRMLLLCSEFIPSLRKPCEFLSLESSILMSVCRASAVFGILKHPESQIAPRLEAVASKRCAP